MTSYDLSDTVAEMPAERLAMAETRRVARLLADRLSLTPSMSPEEADAFVTEPTSRPSRNGRRCFRHRVSEAPTANRPDHRSRWHGRLRGGSRKTPPTRIKLAFALRREVQKKTAPVVETRGGLMMII